MSSGIGSRGSSRGIGSLSVILKALGGYRYAPPVSSTTLYQPH